jgi:hypothetical protein
MHMSGLKEVRISQTFAFAANIFSTISCFQLEKKLGERGTAGTWWPSTTSGVYPLWAG